ncbi:unnamed protein product [Polarella glacialis]|uniref:non-specific serine/threonine protein kinase n=1 Tax=Polarella glacialis TaxID=89957 RepID=A0A813DG00_POLGL|nr:unnamed protein product [Polarella glacialis]
MTTPGTHNDTYASTCHRMFFERWHAGVDPRDCTGNDGHNVDTVDGLILPLVALLHELGRGRSEEVALATGLEVLSITRKSTELPGFIAATAGVLGRVLDGMSLPDAAQAEAYASYGDANDLAREVERRGSRDPVVACYIGGSFPALLHFAFKYGAASPIEALLASANAGGENVHRGAVLGALVGASGGIHALPEEFRKGLVHHDQLESEISDFVKNVFLGGNEKTVLTSFHVAERDAPEPWEATQGNPEYGDLREQGEKCGTPAYMSPELHTLSRRSRGYGFPADIWALGLCIYQMIYGGRHPFVDSRGQLDENLLLNGTLTFGEEDAASSSFGGLFKSLTLNLDMISGRPPAESDSADSAGARQFCRSLVNIDPACRSSAVSALRSTWLGRGFRLARSLPSRRNSSPAIGSAVLLGAPSPHKGVQGSSTESFVCTSPRGGALARDPALARRSTLPDMGLPSLLGSSVNGTGPTKTFLAPVSELSVSSNWSCKTAMTNKVAIISHAGNFQRSGTPGRIVPDGRKAEFVSVCSPLSATPGASFSNVSFSAEEPNSYRKLQLLQAKACQKGSTQLSWRCIIAATDDCQESAERFRRRTPLSSSLLLLFVLQVIANCCCCCVCCCRCSFVNFESF